MSGIKSKEEFDFLTEELQEARIESLLVKKVGACGYSAVCWVEVLSDIKSKGVKDIFCLCGMVFKGNLRG